MKNQFDHVVNAGQGKNNDDPDLIKFLENLLFKRKGKVEEGV